MLASRFSSCARKSSRLPTGPPCAERRAPPRRGARAGARAPRPRRPCAANSGDLGADALVVGRADRLPQALGELLLVRRDRLRHQRRDLIDAARASRARARRMPAASFAPSRAARRDELVERAPAQLGHCGAQRFPRRPARSAVRPASAARRAMRSGAASGNAFLRRFGQRLAGARAPRRSMRVALRRALGERQAAVDLAARDARGDQLAQHRLERAQLVRDRGTAGRGSASSPNAARG